MPIAGATMVGGQALSPDGALYVTLDANSAITGTTITATTQLIAPDGTSGAVGLRFSSDTATGWYRFAANQWAWSDGNPRILLVGNRIGQGADGIFAWSNAGGSLATFDTGVSRVSPGVIGAGTGASGSVAGTFVSTAYDIGGVAAAATSGHRVIKKVASIADNTATDVFTVTVPNANHSAGIKISFVSSNGSTDAFESTRVAEGFVVLARTTGANVVPAVAALTLAQIATVSGGATHTLAYGVSAVTGAVGDPNTFTIQVTIDDSGNLGSNQVIAIAEVINSEATGVTIA